MPAPMPSPRFSHAHPQPPKKSFPWIAIAVPAGIVLLLGALFVACLTSVLRSVAEDERKFIATRPTRPCTAPRTCRSPDRTGSGTTIDGVDYGACVGSASSAADVFTDGDIVFVSDGNDTLARLARIVEVPNAAQYRIESVNGGTEIVPRTHVVGRICVLKPK